jgi:DNA-binding NtrC family response regulator
MLPFPVPILPVPRITNPRPRPRTAVVASADRCFRQRLIKILTGLRWQVKEAEGGAQAWSEVEDSIPEAVVVDAWLPDLDLAEFLRDFRVQFPEVDLVTAAGLLEQESPRGPYRQELLYALRHIEDLDTGSGNPAHPSESGSEAAVSAASSPISAIKKPVASCPAPVAARQVSDSLGPKLVRAPGTAMANFAEERLPELVGNAECMLEISRRVRLVASRMTPVLIEGPTGSGKELVAEALHRLSARSRKPLIAINCAAIPEALLEAELFGHTRGAFTGAVQGRVGRIEAADGGTLFLDEIGEMPLALQAKLLRFVECGELQRVGDNETVKVDVRVIAATHRALAAQAQSGAFRADLYYRLAVFLIRTPALIEHREDVPMLVDHFLDKLGRDQPMKHLDETALAKLDAHDWPGNVRELEHVLERGVILAGDSPVLTARDIDFGLSVN